MNLSACFHETVLLAFISLCVVLAARGTASATSEYHQQFEDTPVRNAVGNLFRLIEGTPGAVTLLVLGIGAIIAAAFRRFRTALRLFWERASR